MRRNASGDADRPASRNLSSLRFLGRFLRPYRWQLAVAAIALIFTSSAVLGLGGGLRYLVDEGLSKGDHALLNRAFGVLISVTVLLAVATATRYYFISWIGERVVADIRRSVYDHLLKLDIAYYETTHSGEILSRLNTDTTLLQTVVGSSVSVAARNTLLLIGGTALLLFTSARLTEYMFIMLPCVVAPILILGRSVRKLSRANQEMMGKLSVHAQESLSGMRMLRAFALEGWESSRYAGQVRESLNIALARIRLRAFLTGIVILLVFGAVITVLWIGGQDVLNQRITPGELSSFVFYSVVVAGAIGALSEVAADLQRAAGATDRLQEIMAITPLIEAPASPRPVPEAGPARIRFEDVDFAYPAHPETLALEGIQLSVEAGQVVALVGHSGAGKSTVLQLLLRLYDPVRGAIRFDDVDIRDFDPLDLRHLMALVPQDPTIFSGTARENIRFGHPTATEEDIERAAREAAAYDFIQRLPQGWDTPLGERGVKLSGGERQRIAIARALLRDPRILLLDEATSALDAEHEQRVQHAMQRLMEGRTTFVIAHRLATVQGADRILVMDQGKIIASGTHAELLAQSPLYARLASLQFAA